MRTCLLLIKRLPVTFIVALFFISCGQSRKEVAQLLAQAEAAPAQYPDSALHYLNAIQHPTRLNKAQHAHYHLLRVQAKDKAGQDISADTVIGEVKNYFLHKKDFPQAALAAFYEGRVFQCRGNVPQALQAFLEAGTLAGHGTNDKRKGLIQYNISSIYYTNRTDYSKAIAHAKEAAEYFRQSGDTAYQMEALRLQGICFLLAHQSDSALQCQQHALDIAAAQNDTLNQAFILRSISSIYRVKGDFAQAKTYALRAMEKGDRDTLKALLNMAYIHYDCHEYEPAAGYARRLLQYGRADSACAIPASLYHLLAKIAEHKNDYREALEYTNKYQALMDDMHKKQEAQSLAGIRERYELELLQTEKQMAEIRASRKLLAAFLVAAVSIIAVLVFIIGYLRYKKRFMKTKAENDRLYGLRIDLVKKTDNTWESLYAILDERHKGAVGRLQQQLPLPEQDFQICCFAYAGFSDKEIATYMQLSPNTIKSRKSRIRKQLRIAERGSIEKFMAQKLQNEMVE